jgi:SAM-dependent methyltransferase
MAHVEQADFCLRLKQRWPHLFQNKRVLDCGSLDINGNNRYLFAGGSYVGVDIFAGPNVDIVLRIHEVKGGPFDVVISTECLEHDEFSELSIGRMIDLLTDGGILIITCATTGRPEHGTFEFHDWASPGTLDHYKNITHDELTKQLARSFRCWGVEVQHSDIYAWGLDPIRKATHD